MSTRRAGQTALHPSLAARRRLARALLGTALLLALGLLALDRAAAYLHRPGPGSMRVAIYTTQTCPYCARLRAMLSREGVAYTEYDVERSVQGLLGFWALRARGVPVSVIGPEVVYGFQAERIEAALHRLRFSAAQAPAPRGAATGP